MASSATPAPSSALGRCVVCGKETSTGCSKCARVGLDWMYFCSVEHHKLVIWSVHKQVCGKNPFEWPPLNESEAKEMWERRNEYCGNIQLSEVLVGAYRRSDLNLDQGVTPGIIVAIMLEAGKTRQINLNSHNKFIKFLRASAFQSKLFPGRVDGCGREVSAAATRRLLVEDPFGAMAYLINVHLPLEARTGQAGVNLSEPETAIWMNKLEYRLLVLLAKVRADIVDTSRADNCNTPEYVKSLQHAVSACNVVPSSLQSPHGGAAFIRLIENVYSFVDIIARVRE